MLTLPLINGSRVLLIAYAVALIFKGTPTLQAALLLVSLFLLLWEKSNRLIEIRNDILWLCGPLLIFSLWLFLISGFWREPPLLFWDPNSWDMVQPWFSLKQWRRDILQPMVAMLCGYWAFQEELWRRRLFVAMGIVLLLLLAKSLCQFYWGEFELVNNSVTGWSLIHQQGTLFVRGFSHDNNFFAYILYLLTPGVIWLVIKRPTGWRGWLTIGCALILLYLIFLNKRRGTWLALYVEMLVVAAFLGRKHLGVLLVGTVLLAGGAYQIRPHWFKRDYDTTSPQLMKAPGRDQITKDTMKLIPVHPVVGVGYGKDTVVKNYWHRVYQHTHNHYLNTLLAIGLPGLLIWLTALFEYARRFWNRRLDGLESCIGLAFVIGFYVRNLSDDIWLSSLAELFWFLVGVLLLHQSHLKKDTT